MSMDLGTLLTVVTIVNSTGWPQITLKSMMTTLHHIGSAGISDTQTSMSFTTPSRFRVTWYSETSVLSNPKITLKLQSQKYHIWGREIGTAYMIYAVPSSLPFTLWLAISKIFAIFHFPLGHNVKFQFLHITFLNSKKSLLCGLSQGTAIKSLVETKCSLMENCKCTKWPQNGLEHYKVNSSPNVFNLNTESQTLFSPYD